MSYIIQIVGWFDMGNIFIPDDKTSNKLKEKDCQDFKPLDDGTLAGDPKYCEYSFICRQMGMKSDYVVYTGPGLCIKEGLIQKCYYEGVFDYFCTGKYAKIDERGLDEEAS